ncbi:biotin-dependent carboxyltransferase family protein [Rhizobium sp. L80/93]|uniref:5-oxoprolinase subunit C family protein n=1 Tax=Rhizobium sp. E27B/91 TaxID=2819995 RepID=UPI001ADD0461|nr:biotin-dependent carboxyltransferase family protein [Rhizobium sp. E27B/91]MBO9187525.1 biotin-dependent carboxyltransferase family protein [Rhizobium sp. E27B/91]
MSFLEIHGTGPMTTVQDLGRKGLQHAGVSGAGPMDGPSFRIANALVGNPATSAALEFAAVGGRFTVTRPVRFAVTGGDVDVSIDGSKVHPWESHHLLPGMTLAIDALRDCVWGYLAISGGIDTVPVLGSRSTHLRTGLGGYEGRRLEIGDRLPLGDAAPLPNLALRQPFRRSGGPIRVICGPQDDYFSNAAVETFLEASFVVSAARDRMAQMLDGPPIAADGGHDIVSDGTSAGSIQVPSSGRLIVLMAERQTTGGYPKIATVASVDLPRLAQAVSGRSIRFARIAQEQAEELLVAERHLLGGILDNLAVKPESSDRSGGRVS